MASGLQSRPDSYQMLPSDQFGQFRDRCLRRSAWHLVGKIISVGSCGDGDDKASACKNLLKKNSDVASTLDGFWLTLSHFFNSSLVLRINQKFRTEKARKSSMQSRQIFQGEVGDSLETHTCNAPEETYNLMNNSQRSDIRKISAQP